MRFSHFSGTSLKWILTGVLTVSVLGSYHSNKRFNLTINAEAENVQNLTSNLAGAASTANTYATTTDSSMKPSASISMTKPESSADSQLSSSHSDVSNGSAQTNANSTSSVDVASQGSKPVAVISSSSDSTPETVSQSSASTSSGIAGAGSNDVTLPPVVSVSAPLLSVPTLQSLMAPGFKFDVGLNVSKVLVDRAPVIEITYYEASHKTPSHRKIIKLDPKKSVTKNVADQLKQLRQNGYLVTPNVSESTSARQRYRFIATKPQKRGLQALVRSGEPTTFQVSGLRAQRIGNIASMVSSKRHQSLQSPIVIDDETTQRLHQLDSGSGAQQVSFLTSYLLSLSGKINFGELNQPLS